MKNIKNPILRGFNPDPSIVRVGDDYYIATSTFEWFPGIQIHHSRDLINWRLAARPLNRISQLDMTGCECSAGIWAPCLSYHNGTYYLAFSNVKSFGNPWQDTRNYIVTSNDIFGEWSEPVLLNCGGYDPSIFHDDDGRKWLVFAIYDYRKTGKKHAGIMLQEYSQEENCLVGSSVKIFDGTDLGVTEGPHIFKKNGFYYLITAEGGTGWGHAVTVARSHSITGPYEVHPNNPILTSRDDLTLTLQKSGHGDIVETQNGDWYIVHLSTRPITENRKSILGRETCIQKVVWREDGWLYLDKDGNKPDIEVPAPALTPKVWPTEAQRDDFNETKLNIHFQTLRIPLGEDTLSLTERPGYLRLKGKESLYSKYRQALVARRQQAFCYTASTCVEFDPQNFDQMAGLICLHDTHSFYYLRVSRDEKLGKCIGIISNISGTLIVPAESEVCIEGWERCHLRVEVDFDKLQFYYSDNGYRWKPIGPVLDACTLADESSCVSWFTGAFVGLCCQDISGCNRHADFDYFEYVERYKYSE